MRTAALSISGVALRRWAAAGTSELAILSAGSRGGGGGGATPHGGALLPLAGLPAAGAKRRRTGYHVFVQRESARLRAQQPHHTQQRGCQKVSALAQLWKGLPPADKLAWARAALADDEREAASAVAAAAA